MSNICILTDKLEILKEEFYSRDTAKVAQDLLGKKLIRKTECKENFMSGIIVETKHTMEKLIQLQEPTMERRTITK